MCYASLLSFMGEQQRWGWWSVINEVRLSGFQGFGREKEHIAPLRPFTLIYGPNASGKSSLLRAVKLINQSMRNEPEGVGPRSEGFNFEGSLVSLASFANASHRHEIGKFDPIDLGVTYETQSASNQFDAIAGLFGLVSVDWSLADPGIVSRVSLKFHSRDESIADLSMSFDVAEDGRRLDLSWVDGDLGQLGTVVDHPNFSSYIPRPPKLYRDDSLEKKELAWDFDAALSELKDGYWADEFLDENQFELSGIFPVLRPYRGNLHRSEASDWNVDLVQDQRRAVDVMFYQLKAEIFSALLGIVRNLGRRASSGTTAIAPLRVIQERLSFQDSSNTATQRRVEERNTKLEEQISSWLERLTGDRYSYKRVTFVPEEMSIFGALKSVQVVDNQTNTRVAFADVGVGLSQVLPILDALALPNLQGGAGKTILIEQPELHLHPKMQAELAELFVEAVSSRRVQIIAETHSEAFLLRVQKCLREKKISPFDVQILYVDSAERDWSGGNDRPKELVTDGTAGMKTNSIRAIPLSQEDDFEAELPQSFAGLRLSEYL